MLNTSKPLEYTTKKTVQMGTIFPFETSEKKIIEWAKNAVKTNKHLFTASDIPENTGYMMENF